MIAKSGDRFSDMSLLWQEAGPLGSIQSNANGI
jgi:hypothetical protein